MIINLSNNSKNFVIDENYFEQIAQKIAQTILSGDIIKISPLGSDEFVDKELSFDILLTNNQEIHEINKNFRNKDMPTDIITFALFADSEPAMRMVAGNELPLGEMIISLERIKTQAQENNKTFEEELFFILAHGILHLFGFVHLSDEQLNQMIELQNRLVNECYVKI